MSRYIGVFLILSTVVWAAFGCSSSTEPEVSAVDAYHYTVLGGKRYFEEKRWKDTLGVTDTLLVDTLTDSLWRRYTDTAGVYWAESVRKEYRLPPDTTQAVVEPAGTVTRRVGLLGDSLFIDPTIMEKVLVGPLQTGRRWFVRADSTIAAVVLGQEDLDLGVGTTRAWRVTWGLMREEWWASGLGRVQYEEINNQGDRVYGRLIAVGSL